MSVIASENIDIAQSGRKHSPVARPPDKEAPARALGSAGADFSLTGAGHAKYNESEGVKQQPTSAAPVTVSFSEIVRRSTPPVLLEMARLHRLYMPGEPLPPELQRTLGRAWATGGVR